MCRCCGPSNVSNNSTSRRGKGEQAVEFDANARTPFWQTGEAEKVSESLCLCMAWGGIYGWMPSAPFFTRTEGELVCVSWKEGRSGESVLSCGTKLCVAMRGGNNCRPSLCTIILILTSSVSVVPEPGKSISTHPWMR